MKEKHIKKHSNLEDMPKGKTDWKRVDAMKDEDIDYTDIPETDAAFWADASLEMPETKEKISLYLDRDILQWLRSQGRGYQTRINAYLRKVMEIQRKAG